MNNHITIDHDDQSMICRGCAYAMRVSGSGLDLAEAEFTELARVFVEGHRDCGTEIQTANDPDTA
jgi:hypothetical protein